MIRRPVLSSVIASIVCVAASLTSPAVWADKGDLTIGIGPDVYIDDGTITGSSRRSVQVDETDFDFHNDTYVAGELWIATEVIDGLRLGGGIKTLGSYEYIRAEDQDEDDPDVSRLGQLLELTLRLEYLLELVTFEDKMALDLLLGLEIGVAMLIPDGEFEREIDTLQDQDVGVLDAPRLGYVVGPQVGLRFKYNDTLAFRLQVAVNWEQLFLFDVDEEVSGVAVEESRRADIIRVHVGIALEATL